MEVKTNYYYFAIVLAIFTITLPANAEYFSKTTPAKLPVLKKTSLHFYLHDILSGKNPGAVLAAHPNITLGPPSATPFGSVYAIDDLVTAGPEANSTVIGNAQGLYLSSSKDTLSLVLYVDFGFTSGKFNGSSISVFSRNPIMERNREVAIVGGRGLFKMAKGYAKLKAYSFDMKSGDAVIEYHVVVYHY
ncbi:dirigent protein 4-like [Silene latifolia]|uniref:dirigent protein 4-like n=1 Tax=Silene latifolia TaxID=37657 RepID=UPI003D78079D